VSFMRMFGLGLTLAVLGDATLVRMLLVPAFMHVMGRFNWWSTRLLAWLHKKLPMNEPRRPSAPPAQQRSYSPPNITTSGRRK